MDEGDSSRENVGGTPTGEPPDHSFNKNAKTCWVSKMIIDKLKNNDKMKLNKMVSNVRLMFVIKITGSRAFKSRTLARQIIEGGSSKQYSLIWAYDAELRKASLENTFKLNSGNLRPDL